MCECFRKIIFILMYVGFACCHTYNLSLGSADQWPYRRTEGTWTSSSVMESSLIQHEESQTELVLVIQLLWISIQNTGTLLLAMTQNEVTQISHFPPVSKVILLERTPISLRFSDKKLCVNHKYCWWFCYTFFRTAMQNHCIHSCWMVRLSFAGKSVTYLL